DNYYTPFLVGCLFLCQFDSKKQDASRQLAANSMRYCLLLYPAELLGIALYCSIATFIVVVDSQSLPLPAYAKSRMRWNRNNLKLRY
ncbi:hypothetical protein, partial [Parageobacillus thermoglucosidasius]|uniref:hypothetical protein n=1 Tax=Parageobacillus thermoglucosidasius TaxID=1426 RepID=UPI001C3F348C